MNTLTADPAPTASRAQTRWALASLALAMLMSSLSISSANVALPTIARSFAAPFGTVQWVVIAYLLAVTVFSVGAGRLADIVGPRRVLLGGILVFTAASAVCAAAPDLAALVVARGIQGLGGAALLALTVAMVRDAVPSNRTGSAMGLLGTMSAVGTALGPSLGGALIAGAGWRSIFVVMVAMGIVAAALARRSLPADTTPTSRPAPGALDARGILLLALTLAAFCLAATAGDDVGAYNVVLIAIAAGGLVLFLRSEARAPSPMIRLAELADPALRAGLGANLLVSSVMTATFLVGPFYLSRSLGLGEAMVGLVMSVGPVVSALTGIPAGRIVDRFRAPRIIVFGLAEMAIGALLLALLPGIAGVAGYIAALAVLTPGYQLFLAANNTAVMTGVADDRRGIVSGTLSLSRNLGFIAGASLMGAVLRLRRGRTGRHGLGRCRGRGPAADVFRRRRPHGRRGHNGSQRQGRGAPRRHRPMRPEFRLPSALLFRQAHDEAVEIRRHLDLATEAGVRLALGHGAVEHLVFRLGHLRQLVEEGLVHIEVAGGAAAGAAALALNAGDAVQQRALHQAPALGQVDLEFATVMFDIGYFRHLSLSEMRGRVRAAEAVARHVLFAKQPQAVASSSFMGLRKFDDGTHFVVSATRSNSG